MNVRVLATTVVRQPRKAWPDQKEWGGVEKSPHQTEVFQSCVPIWPGGRFQEGTQEGELRDSEHLTPQTLSSLPLMTFHLSFTSRSNPKAALYVHTSVEKTLPSSLMFLVREVSYPSAQTEKGTDLKTGVHSSLSLRGVFLSIFDVS